jgi:hypothetical protein
MKIAVFCFLLLTGMRELLAQGNIRPCKDTFKTNVLSYRPSESSDLIKDSLIRKITLVFEQNFNDSISIFVNDSLFETSFFKTIHNLGVCKNTVSIDYSELKGVPRISVVVHSKNDCISFYPRADKRMVYITWIQRGWSVDLSNVIRHYM